MIQNTHQLANNLIKIYRIKIHSKNKDTITHYLVEDYGYKKFIFTKNQLHNLILQSAKYHGFRFKSCEAFCIFVRKIIDEKLLQNLALLSVN